jgi:hypothetical protein
MTDEVMRAYWAGTTRALPPAVEEDAETRRARRLRQDAERRAVEGQRSDGLIDGSEMVLDLRDTLTGGRRRDRYGNVLPGPVAVEESIPDAISGDELDVMLRGGPRATPNVEPTVEQRFRAEAEKQRHRAWQENVRDRFDALLRSKETGDD